MVLACVDEKTFVYIQKDEVYKISATTSQHTTEAHSIKLENITTESASIVKNDEQSNITSKDSSTSDHWQILCLACAPQHICIATNRKELLLLDLNFTKLKQWKLTRTPSKVVFDSQSKHILVADKSGDIFLFNVAGEALSSEEPTIGHLSLVLDVKMSNNCKLIASCDRDEKIRISNYPNTYNVQSFCLGHKEFVTNIEFITNDILVSSSGDGYIIAWDVNTGNILSKVDTSSLVDSVVLDGFIKRFDEDQFQITTLPVNKMKYNASLQVLLFTLLQFDAIFVYDVKQETVGDIKLLYSSKINFTDSILDFDICKLSLFVVLIGGIRWFKFDEKSRQYEIINEQIDIGAKIDTVSNDEYANVNILYKRRFDNVEQYQKKKKIRMESS